MKQKPFWVCVSACICICTVLHVLMYLSVRPFLQRGLYHNVALHAHLELRNLGRYTAITRRPQCSQELASSDGVHYHSPILTHSERQVRVSKHAITSTLFLFLLCKPWCTFWAFFVYVVLVSQCNPGFLNQRHMDSQVASLLEFWQPVMLQLLATERVQIDQCKAPKTAARHMYLL